MKGNLPRRRDRTGEREKGGGNNSSHRFLSTSVGTHTVLCTAVPSGVLSEYVVLQHMGEDARRSKVNVFSMGTNHATFFEEKAS